MKDKTKMICDQSGPCLPQLIEDRNTRRYKVTHDGCCLFCGTDLNNIIEELDGTIQASDAMIH